MVSLLVAARDEADALTEEELITFVVLLLLAGNETTTNLIGNGMLALGRNPDEMQRLIREPQLMQRDRGNAALHCPVQSTAPYPKIDVTVDGVELKANTVTFVMVAAANRHPGQFPNPGVFDITREPNDHQAFGDGIHHCLGAPLARTEGAIAIGTALARFPGLRLVNPDQQLTYKASYFLRGLAELPMALD